MRNENTKLSHLRYIYRFLQGLKDPYQFTYFKKVEKWSSIPTYTFITFQQLRFYSNDLLLKIGSFTNLCHFFRDCYLISNQILYLPALQSIPNMQTDNQQESSQQSPQKCTESTSCNLNKNTSLELPPIIIDNNQKITPPAPFVLDCQSKVIDHISKSFYKIDVKQIE